MFFVIKSPARRIVVALAVTAVAVWQVSAGELKPEVEKTEPAAEEPAGARPSELLEQRPKRPAPELTGDGATALKQAMAFVEWAAEATAGEDDLVREAVARGRDNAAIVEALCEHVYTVREVDHSRALVTLSLLGEMRSRYAVKCLAKVVSLPLPEKGTVVEGEIIERTALEILQAKAIDGLAYFNDRETDELVLKAVAENPSRIVRAEAVAAYLWNHQDSDEARRNLSRYVRSDEKIFLDRVVRGRGEKAESFNPKLEAFLKAHPELMPPPPEQREVEPDDQLPKPPKF